MCSCPNRWLLGYMETHGGLWAGLPRFHHGLDAAYSIGVIKELINRSTEDIRYRNQALAGLQSFFLHAASRNGYTLPEVAGLFPYRLDAGAYERLVREVALELRHVQCGPVHRRAHFVHRAARRRGG